MYSPGRAGRRRRGPWGSPRQEQRGQQKDVERHQRPEHLRLHGASSRGNRVQAEVQSSEVKRQAWHGGGTATPATAPPGGDFGHRRTGVPWPAARQSRCVRLALLNRADTPITARTTKRDPGQPHAAGVHGDLVGVPLEPGVPHLVRLVVRCAANARTGWPYTTMNVQTATTTGVPARAHASRQAAWRHVASRDFNADNGRGGFSVVCIRPRS